VADFEDIVSLLAEDARQKRLARGRPGLVGKKKPRKLINPSDLENRRRGPPWWQVAEIILQVDILTGEVLLDRLAELWPGRR